MSGPGKKRRNRYARPLGDKIAGSFMPERTSLRAGPLSYIIEMKGELVFMDNRTFPLLLAASALLLSGTAAQAAPRTDLAPHKAIYNIKMTAKKSGSPVLNISGEMYFELKAGCEAWTTDHRFNLNYEYADSPPMLITSDFTTYEPYDGKTLDFNSRRHRNNELFEEMRGQAKMDGEKGGAALYTMPADLRFNLPPGALYPMAHTAALREQVKAGKKFFSAVVFDGSDEDGPAEINAFVGKKVDTADLIAPGKDIDPALIKVPAHSLRMAFFPLSAGESSAEYEMSAVFHENGIISDMTVEYKEFTVHQALKALQSVPPEDCAAANTEKKPKAGKTTP